MVIGHLHTVLLEGVPQVLPQGQIGAPPVVRRGPAVDGVFDGALLVGGEVNRGSGILQQVLRHLQGPPAGGLHRLRRRVVGGCHLLHHPPLSQHCVIGHLGGGQLLVGQHHQVSVRRHQLGVVQPDLMDGAGHAADLHIVPDGEGMGGQDHQPAGHIAQDVLRRQGHAQGPHRQQRHQGGHGDIQALRHDQHRDDVEDQLDSRQQVFLDAPVQLGPGQQPPQQLAQQVDGHQADQQRGSGGEDRPEGELGQRVCEQGSEVRHSGASFDSG